MPAPTCRLRKRMQVSQRKMLSRYCSEEGGKADGQRMMLGFGAALSATQDRAMTDRDQFVGAWRLAWMEEPGPDGQLIRRTERKGSLIYTRDGRMAVQIQFPDSQSSVSNDYVLNGYEASFARYEVDEAAGTTTRHVEGSVTGPR